MAGEIHEAKMAKDVMKYLVRKKPRGFQPRPYYGSEEDSLTYYFNNAESYARRVDQLLTLFLSAKTDDLVGFQVKGVREKLKQLGGFGIAIKHGRVRCDLFFHLLAFLAEKPAQRQKCLDLSQRTKNVDLELDEIGRGLRESVTGPTRRCWSLASRRPGPSKRPQRRTSPRPCKKWPAGWNKRQSCRARCSSASSAENDWLIWLGRVSA